MGDNMNKGYDFFMCTVQKCINKRNHLLKNKAKEYGINAPEADVILFLSKHDISMAAEIVKECSISKAFVSKLMIGLMAKKLITITKDENDKRCQNIALTEKAKKIAEDLDSKCGEFLTGISAEITDEEKQVMIAVFKKIEKNLGKLS